MAERGFRVVDERHIPGHAPQLELALQRVENLFLVVDEQNPAVSGHGGAASDRHGGSRRSDPAVAIRCCPVKVALCGINKIHVKDSMK
jgi:hypothetical protein